MGLLDSFPKINQRGYLRSFWYHQVGSTPGSTWVFWCETTPQLPDPSKKNIKKLEFAEAGLEQTYFSKDHLVKPKIRNQKQITHKAKPRNSPPAPCLRTCSHLLKKLSRHLLQTIPGTIQLRQLLGEEELW